VYYAWTVACERMPSLQYYSLLISYSTASLILAWWQTSLMNRKCCYFVVRVRCRRKKSSRSLSHLVISFLLVLRSSVETKLWWSCTCCTLSLEIVLFSLVKAQNRSNSAIVIIAYSAITVVARTQDRLTSSNTSRSTHSCKQISVLSYSYCTCF